MLSKLRYSFAIASLLSLAPSLAFAQTGLHDLSRNRANQTLDLQASVPIQIATHGEVGQRMLVGISAGFMLELSPHSIRAPGFRILTPDDQGGYAIQRAAEVRTMRGHIVGRPDSLVAGSLLDDGLYARIVVSPTE